MSITTARIEYHTAEWSITATSSDGKFYAVECVHAAEGGDVWDGAVISGHALTAAIMLAQLKSTGLSIKHSGCAALVPLAQGLPEDMPRFWV